MNMHFILDSLVVAVCLVFCCGRCGYAFVRIFVDFIGNVEECAHCIFIELILISRKICIRLKMISLITQSSITAYCVFVCPYSYVPLSLHILDKVDIVEFSEVDTRIAYSDWADHTNIHCMSYWEAVDNNLVVAELHSSFFNLQQN